MGAWHALGTHWQEVPRHKSRANKHSLGAQTHTHGHIRAFAYTHSCWLACLNFYDKLTEGPPAFTPTQLQEPTGPLSSVNVCSVKHKHVRQPAGALRVRGEKRFSSGRDALIGFYRKLFTVQNERRSVSSQNSPLVTLLRARTRRPSSSTRLSWKA